MNESVMISKVPKLSKNIENRIKKDDAKGNETIVARNEIKTLNNDNLEKLMRKAMSGIKSYEYNEKKVDRFIWSGWFKVL